MITSKVVVALIYFITTAIMIFASTIVVLIPVRYKDYVTAFVVGLLCLLIIAIWVAIALFILNIQ